MSPVCHRTFHARARLFLEFEEIDQGKRLIEDGVFTVYRDPAVVVGFPPVSTAVPLATDARKNTEMV